MSELSRALPRAAEPRPLLRLPPRGVQEGLPSQLSGAHREMHESQVSVEQRKSAERYTSRQLQQSICC